MNKGPILFLLFILAIFSILYFYLNKETHYRKFDTLGKYTIYIRQENDSYQELIYVDQNNEYFINKQYVLKSQFKTLSLKEALLNEIISLKEAMILFPEITMKPTDYILVGHIDDYTIYESERMTTKCKKQSEYFFLDDLNEYYFDCPMSKYYLIRGKNADYTITEALEEKIIQIDDLKPIIPAINTKAITYQVIERKTNLEIVETIHKYETKEDLEIIYLIDNKIYYFISPMSKFYKIKVNSQYYTLQDALALKFITIDELRLFIPEINER